MKKPNLFIVGAAKAGTTALHAILSDHPQVFMSPVKEPNYFSTDIDFKNLSKDNKKKYYSKLETDKNGIVIPRHFLFVRELDDYLSLFKNATKSNKVIGESSVSYLYSNEAARNIYSFNRNAKIVVVLRNPIDRALSHYKMVLRTRGDSSRDLLQTIVDDYSKPNKTWGGNSHLFIELGLYFEQIKRYTILFPENQIYIIDYKDFLEDQKTVVDGLYRFLEIDSIEGGNFSKRNESAIPRSEIVRIVVKNSFVKQLLSFFVRGRLKRVLKTVLFSKKKSRDIKLSLSDRRNLEKYFVEDLEKLNKELNVNLKV